MNFFTLPIKEPSFAPLTEFRSQYAECAATIIEPYTPTNARITPAKTTGAETASRPEHLPSKVKFASIVQNTQMKYATILLLAIAFTASAQLDVNVSPPKLTGQKAIVRLELKNDFKEEIKSARAAVFLLDQNGKMVAQGTRRVIGGDKTKTGLPPGSTNRFYFTLTASRPFATTNLMAKVTFERVVLEGNRVADVAKDVVIKK